MIKTDFVPDKNFTWDLDLDKVAKGKKKKTKQGFKEPTVIKN